MSWSFYTGGDVTQVNNYNIPLRIDIYKLFLYCTLKQGKFTETSLIANAITATITNYGGALSNAQMFLDHLSFIKRTISIANQAQELIRLLSDEDAVNFNEAAIRM